MSVFVPVPVRVLVFVLYSAPSRLGVLHHWAYDYLYSYEYLVIHILRDSTRTGGMCTRVAADDAATRTSIAATVVCAFMVRVV